MEISGWEGEGLGWERSRLCREVILAVAVALQKILEGKASTQLHSSELQASEQSYLRPKTNTFELMYSFSKWSDFCYKDNQR